MYVCMYVCMYACMHVVCIFIIDTSKNNLPVFLDRFLIITEVDRTELSSVSSESLEYSRERLSLGLPSERLLRPKTVLIKKKKFQFFIIYLTVMGSWRFLEESELKKNKQLIPNSFFFFNFKLAK